MVGPRYAYRYRLLFITTFLVVGCGGCGQIEPASQAISVTQTEIPIQPIPTHIPITQVDEPSEPTAIPTPRGDVPLSEQGPWWVFSTKKCLWAINSDGSGLRRLTDPEYLLSDLAEGVAPKGGHLVYITGTNDINGLTLNLLSFPDGDSRIITLLSSPGSEPSDTSEGSVEYEAARAITYVKSFDWSPDGTSLAFMGMLQGPTSDLYVYSLAQDSIVRHTDGPTQGIRPIYSPLGDFILHAGVASMGSGAGYDMRGFWAGRADGSEFRSLLDPTDSGDEVVVGWIDPETFLVYSWYAFGGMRNLRIINIVNGETYIIWEGCFLDTLALDESTGTVLLAVPSAYSGCIPGVDQGLYLVSALDGSSARIFEGEIRHILWYESASAFLFIAESGMFEVDRNDTILELDVPPDISWFPSISQDTQQIAWAGESGVWLGVLPELGDQPTLKIFDRACRFTTWSPDGTQLIIVDRNGSLYIARAPKFVPVLVASDLITDGFSSTWVGP